MNSTMNLKSSLCFILLILSMASIQTAMASSAPESALYIIYTDNPEDEDPEVYHMRTLASVVGSEEAAKKALIYSYKTAASGFSAKLTPEQVIKMQKKLGVLQVVPSRSLQLHPRQEMNRQGKVDSGHRMNSQRISLYY